MEGNEVKEIQFTISRNGEPDRIIRKAVTPESVWEMRIGKGKKSDIQLEGEEVSRFHAVLEWARGGLTLIDLGSIQSTKLNGRNCNKGPVKDGDVIVICDFTIRVTFFSEVQLQADSAERERMKEREIREIQFIVSRGGKPRQTITKAVSPELYWKVEVGSERDSDIRLEGEEYSGIHVVFSCIKGTFTLVNYGAVHPKLDGSEVNGAMMWKDCKVTIGPLDVLLKIFPGASAATSTSPPTEDGEGNKTTWL